MIARNRRRYGGYIVHLGIVVLFIGIAGSKGFVTEADIAVREGQRAPGGRLHLRQRGRRAVVETPTRPPPACASGVYDGRRPHRHPRPAGHRPVPVDETRASDVAIDSRPSRDLYVVLVQLDDDGVAACRCSSTRSSCGSGSRGS